MELKRSCGILLHPTSLPSKYGIGDLGESAYSFIDFLQKSKQAIWQVLPLGPTSFGDSPYQSFSTFAGNPLLISPDLLLKEGYLNETDLENIPCFDENKVEYGRVITYKYELFKKAFTSFKKNATTEQKAKFSAFCKENEYWLTNYTLFISLKNYFINERKNLFEPSELASFRKETAGLLSENEAMDYFYGAAWCSWPKQLVAREQAAIEEYTQKLIDDIELNKFLQFEFFNQWSSVKAYANERDIEIIGDIPIFVAYDSSDVWAEKEQFKLNEKGYPTVVAGVPPDYFSATGQLWGNPTYNWSVHRKNGYGWWIKRIEKAFQLVDYLRIDHFRGFEANWAVPFGNKTAIEGKWLKGPGIELFNAVEKKLGEVKIIAEDLGVITEPVKKLRKDCGFPGMKILQFAFDSNWKNTDLPHNYTETNSIVYSGTHDNDTSIGWYHNAPEASKDKYRRYLNVSGENAAWDLIRLAYSSVAAFAIVPVQDLLQQDSDYRMNVPGVAVGNWQYRFKLEELSDNIANGLIYLGEIFNRVKVEKDEEQEEEIIVEAEEF